MSNIQVSCGSVEGHASMHDPARKAEKGDGPLVGCGSNQAEFRRMTDSTPETAETATYSSEYQASPAGKDFRR